MVLCVNKELITLNIFLKYFHICSGVSLLVSLRAAEQEPQYWLAGPALHAFSPTTMSSTWGIYMGYLLGNQ